MVDPLLFLRRPASASPPEPGPVSGGRSRKRPAAPPAGQRSTATAAAAAAAGAPLLQAAWEESDGVRLSLDADQVQQLLGMLRQARQSRCTAGISGGSTGRQYMLPDAENAVAGRLAAVSTLLTHIMGLAPSEAEGGLCGSRQAAILVPAAKKRDSSGLLLCRQERPEEGGGDDGADPSGQQRAPGGGRWRSAEVAWRSCALGCLPCAFSPTGRPCILSVPQQPSEGEGAAQGRPPSSAGRIAAGDGEAASSLLRSDGAELRRSAELLVPGSVGLTAGGTAAAAYSCVDPDQSQQEGAHRLVAEESGECAGGRVHEGAGEDFDDAVDDYFDRFAGQMQGGSDEQAKPGVTAPIGMKVEMLL